MKLGDVWFSAIAEAENSDRMIVVSGRTEIEPFIQSGKFKVLKSHGNTRPIVKACPMRLPGN